MRAFVFIFLFSSFAVYAQAPKRFFTRFGGAGDDVGYSAKVTADKQYIITGSTASSGNGNTDVFLAKMDTMGQLMWTKTYGGFSNDIGKSVMQLPDQGYLITGFTNSFGSGGYDAYLIKTDVSGNFVWQATFGGTDWDFANDAVLGADGNIWVVGNTTSFGNGKKDGFVLKYDVSGALLLQKFIGGTENDELTAIINTNDNLIAMTGYTESRGEPNGDGYFVKMNLNGDTLFTRTWGGQYKDYANDLTQKSSGDYIMCGARTYTAGGKTIACMYSYTDLGVFSWDNSFPEADQDNDAFVSCANSTILSNVTGYVRSLRYPVNKMQGQLFTGIHGGWPYILNSSGATADEYLYSTESTTLGGFINVGSTTGFGSLSRDVYFIKHDSTIINYSITVGAEELEQEIISPFIRVHAASVEISFPDAEEKQVEVMDLNGRLVGKTLLASTELIIPTDELAASVYLVRIRYKNGAQYHYKFAR